MVDTGHFPSWSLIEIRNPCNSSSQTFSIVPAFPLVRATDLPTRRARASWYALRIVAAWGTSTDSSLSPYSSQTKVSDRLQAVHLNLEKSGRFSLAS
jgi:hypothetical protein